MTKRLTTMGHRKAFNNYQNLNSKASYKRPKNDKCKKKLNEEFNSVFYEQNDKLKTNGIQ